MRVHTRRVKLPSIRELATRAKGGGGLTLNESGPKPLFFERVESRLSLRSPRLTSPPLLLSRKVSFAPTRSTLFDSLSLSLLLLPLYRFTVFRLPLSSLLPLPLSPLPPSVLLLSYSTSLPINQANRASDGRRGPSHRFRRSILSNFSHINQHLTRSGTVYSFGTAEVALEFGKESRRLQRRRTLPRSDEERREEKRRERGEIEMQELASQFS